MTMQKLDPNGTLSVLSCGKDPIYGSIAQSLFDHFECRKLPIYLQAATSCRKW